MLSLINDRLTRNVFDDVMEVAWSTMWNVTDETAVNCERFLDGHGMDFFLWCLKVNISEMVCFIGITHSWNIFLFTEFSGQRWAVAKYDGSFGQCGWSETTTMPTDDLRIHHRLLWFTLIMSRWNWGIFRFVLFKFRQQYWSLTVLRSFTGELQCSRYSSAHRIRWPIGMGDRDADAWGGSE